MSKERKKIVFKVEGLIDEDGGNPDLSLVVEGGTTEVIVALATAMASEDKVNQIVKVATHIAETYGK